jgi:hypothetical protein
MGFKDLIKQWADDMEEKTYGDNPAKLAKVRQKTARRRAALAAEPEPDLDTLSPTEIELLRFKTEGEIAALENSRTDTEQRIANVKGLSDTPTSDAISQLLGRFANAVSDNLLQEKRLLLHKIQLIIKEGAPPPPQPLSAAEEVAQRMAQESIQRNAAATLLEQQREAEVMQYPEREKAIRKRYGKAIDAILEEE